MKITVFGANGAIGSALIDIALKKGDTVNAFVRNASRFNQSHENLNVFVGDTQNPDELLEAIKGQDVVISAMGPSLKRVRHDTDLPIKTSHEKIVEIMKEVGVKRFITIGTTAIKAKEDKKQMVTVIPPMIAKLAFPRAYAEVTGLGEVVKHSGLDWTIVRFLNPNMKTDGKGYDVSFGDTKGKLNASRKNIAQAMYDAIKKEDWIGKMPIIFNK
ncbi:TPA: NAD(P)H-binding protein [Staphylococcus delphini]|nr:NAD(P)H-binding protein [Staphylococcus delphini]HEC2167539.1 NAD(P)H-binding protein [Staphylococcus delphini]HEC2197045.1 NAD(P)H-binding protein [Staphylococcus delphini]HEC2199212.1 NAD(P)H-binding protein [Staphylococcus delphini]HEC2210337.1 NAD(P)H-binding protein [Staphylococcus delphini]